MKGPHVKYMYTYETYKILSMINFINTLMALHCRSVHTRECHNFVGRLRVKVLRKTSFTCHKRFVNFIRIEVDMSNAGFLIFHEKKTYN